MKKRLKMTKISIAIATLGVIFAILNAAVSESSSASLVILVAMFVILMLNYFSFTKLKKIEREMETKNKN